MRYVITVTRDKPRLGWEDAYRSAPVRVTARVRIQ